MVDWQRQVRQNYQSADLQTQFPTKSDSSGQIQKVPFTSPLIILPKMGATVSKLRHRVLGHDGINLEPVPEDVEANASEKPIDSIPTGTVSITDKNTIFCEICYQYYCVTNQTQCCHHHICSNCAPFLDTGVGSSRCPFCRRSGLKLNHNLQAGELTNPSGNDEPEFTEFVNNKPHEESHAMQQQELPYAA
jgi:hypothetical protein